MSNFFQAIRKYLFQFFDFFKRHYFNIVYYFRRYFPTLKFIMFVIIGIALTWFWVDLNREPYRISSSVSHNGIQIVTWSPERISMGEKYADNLEFRFNSPTTTPMTTTIIITPTAANNAVYFEPALLVVNPDSSGQFKTQKIQIGHKRIGNPKPEIQITVNTQINSTPLLPVDTGIRLNRVNEITVAISTAFTAIMAIWQLLQQFKILRKKKD